MLNGHCLQAAILFGERYPFDAGNLSEQYSASPSPKEPERAWKHLKEVTVCLSEKPSAGLPLRIISLIFDLISSSKPPSNKLIRIHLGISTQHSDLHLRLFSLLCFANLAYLALPEMVLASSRRSTPTRTAFPQTIRPSGAILLKISLWMNRNWKLVEAFSSFDPRLYSEWRIPNVLSVVIFLQMMQAIFRLFPVRLIFVRWSLWQ